MAINIDCYRRRFISSKVHLEDENSRNNLLQRAAFNLLTYTLNLMIENIIDYAIIEIH
jgi:hypothetical protein